jgi:hypothetical protein
VSIKGHGDVSLDTIQAKRRVRGEMIYVLPGP